MRIFVQCTRLFCKMEGNHPGYAARRPARFIINLHFFNRKPHIFCYSKGEPYTKIWDFQDFQLFFSPLGVYNT